MVYIQMAVGGGKKKVTNPWCSKNTGQRSRKENNFYHRGERNYTQIWTIIWLIQTTISWYDSTQNSDPILGSGISENDKIKLEGQKLMLFLPYY